MEQNNCLQALTLSNAKTTVDSESEIPQLIIVGDVDRWRGVTAPDAQPNVGADLSGQVESIQDEREDDRPNTTGLHIVDEHWQFDLQEQKYTDKESSSS